MEYHQQPHEQAKASGAPDFTTSISLGSDYQPKQLPEFQQDFDDDSSQAPSMTDGSSRTSSVYSVSEQVFATGKRANSTKSQASHSLSDTESVWCPQADEPNYQRRQTQSPQQLWRSTVSRYGYGYRL